MFLEILLTAFNCKYCIKCLYIVYKPTASVNGGLLRDPSGKFTRFNNIETSNQNQPSVANPSVTSTISTEGVQPDRRKSFVASRWDPGSETVTDFNVTNEQCVNFRPDNINFSDAPNNDKNSLAAPSESVGFNEMDKNENHYSRPIPVVNSSGKPDGRFKGVLRRKVKHYFLNGIDPESNEDGVRDFLTENEVTFSTVKVFKPRRGDSLAAKITVWEEHAYIVESESFWPTGVTCKQWMTKPELRFAYKQRTDAENLDNENYNRY